jgi:DNA polymerase elongation subunit (family B)
MNECKHPEDRVTHQNKARDRFKCLDCGKWFNHKNHPYSTYVEPTKKAPRVLIFDLETAFLLARVFQVWNQNIGMHQLVDDFDNYWIITWSAKWLFDNEVMSGAVTSKEAIENDDSRIVRQLWDLLDEADVVIAHNAVGFDVPMVNMRFALNGLTPPSPYQVIDTLRVVRKQFKAPHNKLDYWAKQFGIEMKSETTMSLWTKCMRGEKKAIEYMTKYNQRDVTILEELYVILRPWIKSHPNFNLYNGTDNGCSTCGSGNLKLKGTYPTSVNKYDTFQCQDCGSFSRSGKSKKKINLRSIAR